MFSFVSRRLTIAAKDYTDDCISLYLEVNFTICVHCWNLVLRMWMEIPERFFRLNLNSFSLWALLWTPRMLKFSVIPFLYWDVCHTFVAFTDHCFSSEEPIWGIQNIVTFNRLLQLLDQQKRLTIAFRLCWVRDGFLFPPKFITIHPEQPELYMVQKQQTIWHSCV